ncbi:MAG TPA: transposase [Kiritimatiellia bacterium]|nr:transposase [Kiritimatiellia bacterium]HMO98056.1 transposase [Kiritimatiellia bacterium]HMP97002.1 transposase [Kiritimatiellia bacterium]
MSDYRKRPPRLERVFSTYDAPLYFVTMVAWKRQGLLASELVHDALVSHAVFQEAIGVGIGRYVVMPDHLHLFIRVGGDQTLSASIKFLKQAITKALRVSQPDLRVWQPGFFDHLMRNNESYYEKWAYVRENPVRAGLVENADMWPYQGEIVRIDRV